MRFVDKLSVINIPEFLPGEPKRPIVHTVAARVRISFRRVVH